MKLTPFDGDCVHVLTVTYWVKHSRRSANPPSPPQYEKLSAMGLAHWHLTRCCTFQGAQRLPTGESPSHPARCLSEPLKLSVRPKVS